MEKDNGACYIDKRPDGTFTVTLKPMAIAQSLKDKLSSEDIEIGRQIIERQRKLMDIPRMLYHQCQGFGCSLEHETFRAIPNGYTNASVMFISKQPTQYEGCSGFSQCDKQALFFSLILSKMNVTREYVYFTDMVKCYSENVTEPSLRKCVDKYLLKEVEYVKPKLIICNGLNVLQVWKNLGMCKGLPENISYGTIYDVIVAGIPVKIMSIYELTKVLSKTGQDYENCKHILWQQVVTGFTSISPQKGDRNGKDGHNESQHDRLKSAS